MIDKRVNEIIKNPKKSFYKLAAPVMIIMLVQTLYNVVDTIFIGRLGEKAIAAMTFSMPIFFILIALNSGIGVGSNSIISRNIGANKKKNAENCALHGLLITMIASLFIISLSGIFIEPLLTLFGAEGEVLQKSLSYLTIIIFGTLIMFPAFFISSFFTSQGDTKTAMKIQVVSLITNVILDPILIYYLKLGIEGAAIASVCAFVISLILGIYYIKKKSLLNLNLKLFSFSYPILKEIIAIGLPSTLMMWIMSIYHAIINKMMSSYSISHVAGYGITSRLETLAIMPIVAFSIAILTMVGMLKGADKKPTMKKMAWYGIKVNFIITSLLGLILIAFPQIFLRIFTPETNIINIAIPYVRIDVLTLPLIAVSITTSRIMQGLGYGMPGFIINFTRIFIIGMPLAYYFVYILNWSYVYIAVSLLIGAVVAAILSLIWLRTKFLKICSGELC